MMHDARSMIHVVNLKTIRANHKEHPELNKCTHLTGPVKKYNFLFLTAKTQSTQRFCKIQNNSYRLLVFLSSLCLCGDFAILNP